MTERKSLVGAVMLSTAPVKTSNLTPMPTTAGSTQWAAVSTTCGEMIDPEHKLPVIEPGTCDSTITTAGSPVSSLPLMIGCCNALVDGKPLQPTSAHENIAANDFMVR